MFYPRGICCAQSFAALGKKKIDRNRDEDAILVNQFLPFPLRALRYLWPNCLNSRFGKALILSCSLSPVRCLNDRYPNVILFQSFF